jgi:FG-GAP-like repeat
MKGQQRLAFLLCVAVAAAPAEDIFTDITAAGGIHWRHTSGESKDRFLIEAMGGGVAFLDFDNDGLLDIFLVTGGETPHGKSQTPPHNALHRNLGNGKFEDVTARPGLDRIPFYGMGVAAGDYDHDGFPDLYITGIPGSRYFTTMGTAHSPMLRRRPASATRVRQIRAVWAWDRRCRSSPCKPIPKCRCGSLLQFSRGYEKVESDPASGGPLFHNLRLCDHARRDTKTMRFTPLDRALYEHENRLG